MSVHDIPTHAVAPMGEERPIALVWPVKTRGRLFLENACLLGGAILIWMSVLGAILWLIVIVAIGSRLH